MDRHYSFKKCQSCGKLSPWTTKEDDKCNFCNTILTPKHSLEEKEKEESAILARWPFTIIRPEDSVFKAILKNTGWGIQLLLTGILSFFIWLIAAISG